VPLLTHRLSGKIMVSQTKHIEPLARMFHILGDRTRLRIIMLLGDGEMNVSTICKKLKARQPSVSHHLGLLRMGEMVNARRDGKQVFYSLANLARHRYARGLSRLLQGSAVIRLGPVVLGLAGK